MRAFITHREWIEAFKLRLKVHWYDYYTQYKWSFIENQIRMYEINKWK